MEVIKQVDQNLCRDDPLVEEIQDYLQMMLIPSS
jgi:hypothetical protein